MGEQMVAECWRILGGPAARSFWKDISLSNVPKKATSRLAERRGSPKTELAEEAASIVSNAPDQRISRAALDRIVAEFVASDRVVVEATPPGVRTGRPPVFYRWIGDT